MMEGCDNIASYLMRYKGVYRLKTPIDLKTNTFPREYTGEFAENDVFIDCINNIKIFHYGKQILQAYIPSITRGRNIVKAIKQAFQQQIIFDIEETDSEVLFKFNSKYMDDIAEFVKPKTSASHRSPFSTKNIEKIKYQIPDDDLLKYKKIISNIDQSKIIKISHVTKLFLQSICNKKYTYEDLKKDISMKRLGNKEYIHSIGKWEQYIVYLEKELCK